MNIQAAQIVIPTSDLNASLDFFTKKLGFRLEMIMPADSPSVAVISGHGAAIRLEQKEGCSGNAALRLHCNYEMLGEFSEREFPTPGGVRIQLVDLSAPIIVPPIQPGFIITRGDENSWTDGRAGMHYRDLIPERLGGAVVASHIRIPDGGETVDYVHFHRVVFQMIYCKAGWARLVYEGQGPPFIMNAGDCVLQPPEIRHRVLETSDAFEVIEIGCPAVHETYADHDMHLPTGENRPEKLFDGQRFLHHIASGAQWDREGGSAFEVRDTSILEATRGLADVRILRGSQNSRPKQSVCDLSFYYVLEGRALVKTDRGDHQLFANDCCTIPKDTAYTIDTGDSVEILEVLVKNLP